MTTAIKFGGYQGERSVHTRGARVLAEALEKYSDGKARLEFTENITTTGRKAADLLAMTEAGELDGCYFSTSYVADRVAALALFDLHFAVPDRERAYVILDGVIGERIKRKVADETGFALLGYWDNGLRHISATRPIRTPDDCRGLSLRTLDNADHKRVFAALGFAPKAIDVRDLPEAVRTGAVDAQENPLTNIVNFDLHKTQRHVTLTRHLLGVAGLFFNAAAVARWDETLKVAMTAAIAEATAAQRGFAQEDDVVCAEKLRADGGEINEHTAAEHAAFTPATREAVAVTRAKFDPDLLAIFDNALEDAPTPRP